MLKWTFKLVSASNRNLPGLIQEGKFREDLYYRLRVVGDRSSTFARTYRRHSRPGGLFCAQIQHEEWGQRQSVSPQAIEALQRHSWPGNIRELSNAIERAMIFCDGEKIELGDLPRDIVVKA
jgi:DNA-binding NtrC family response regulator